MVTKIREQENLKTPDDSFLRSSHSLHIIFSQFFFAYQEIAAVLVNCQI